MTYSTITALCSACGAGVHYRHHETHEDYDITDPDIPPLVKLAAHGAIVTCQFCGQQHLLQFDMLSELYIKPVNIWE